MHNVASQGPRIFYWHQVKLSTELFIIVFIADPILILQTRCPLSKNMDFSILIFSPPSFKKRKLKFFSSILSPSRQMSPPFLSRFC